jgi:uncharacterized protein with HEPN domain
LRGIRKILARDYTAARYDILWNAAAQSLPQVRGELGELRAD